MENAILQDVFQMIKQCEKEEAQADQEFETTILKSTPVLQHHFEQLYDVKYQLQASQRTATELSQIISTVHHVSEHVSSKIRQLHQAQARVQQSIETIEGFIDIRSCLEGVEDAIAKQEFERATDYVSKVLKLEKNMAEEQLSNTQANSSKNEFIEASMKRNSDVFKQAEKKIKDMIAFKFKEAVQASDEKGVERFAILFAPLGLEQEGLDLYCEYKMSVLKQDLGDLLDKYLIPAGAIELAAVETIAEKKQKRQSVTFIDLITRILDDSAACIESNTYHVEDLFGMHIGSKSTAVYFTTRVQQVCDHAFGTVIDELIKKRDLKTAERQITQWMRFASSALPVTTSNDKNMPPDPRRVDLLLAEIATLYERTQLYIHFVHDLIKEQDSNAKMQETLVEKKMLDLMSLYLPLDDYFLSENIKRAAIENVNYFQKQAQKYASKPKPKYSEYDYDDYDDDEEEEVYEPYNEKSLTTQSSKDADEEEEEEEEEGYYAPFVDDVFFILRKSAARCITTNNVNMISNVLRKISDILTSLYQEYLVEPLQDLQKSKQKNSKIHLKRKDLVQIMIAMNNLDMSSEFVLKLKIQVEKLCIDDTAMFPDENDRHKIKACTLSFNHTSLQFKDILKSNIQQLVTIYLRSDILKGLMPFGQINYDISEAQFNAYETNDPFAQNLVALLEEKMSFVENHMSGNVMDVLIQELATITSSEIEDRLYSKRFNQLGGLQFDKDIRALLLYYSSKTQRTVRDKFAKLTQIASLLKISKLQEVVEYFGESSSSVMTLTMAEVKRVLSLRVGFSKDAIEKIKL